MKRFLFTILLLCLHLSAYGMIPVVPRGQVITVPISPRTPLTVTPEFRLIIPSNAYLLHTADPSCPPEISVVQLPSVAKIKCLQAGTAIALQDLIQRYNIAPGKNSPCWPFFNEMYNNCLSLGFDTKPAIGFGMSAHWLKGSLYGQPWEGCAAGISGNPIRVSLVEENRVHSLIAWESANYWMWILLDRLDLTDGAYIGDAVNRANQECAAIN